MLVFVCYGYVFLPCLWLVKTPGLCLLAMLVFCFLIFCFCLPCMLCCVCLPCLCLLAMLIVFVRNSYVWLWWWLRIPIFACQAYVKSQCLSSAAMLAVVSSVVAMLVFACNSCVWLLCLWLLAVLVFACLPCLCLFAMMVIFACHAWVCLCLLAMLMLARHVFMFVRVPCLCLLAMLMVFNSLFDCLQCLLC